MAIRDDKLFAQRFSDRVAADGDCLRWMGAIKDNGYGVVAYKGRRYHAHRIAVVLDGREIPDGLVIDHLCRNRWCVNPRHLEAVTKSTNAIRGEPGQLHSHCKRGHEMAGDNLYVYGKKRFCRTCAIARSSNRWKETKNERAHH